MDVVMGWIWIAALRNTIDIHFWDVHYAAFCCYPGRSFFSFSYYLGIPSQSNH